MIRWWSAHSDSFALPLRSVAGRPGLWRLSWLVALRKGFQISDDGVELFIADLSVESWHDRLIPGGDLFVRQENRIAQVLFVRGNGRFVGKGHALSVDPRKKRSVNGGIGRVASAAAAHAKSAFARGD